jgi:hypothetical protein
MDGRDGVVVHVRKGAGTVQHTACTLLIHYARCSFTYALYSLYSYAGLGTDSAGDLYEVQVETIVRVQVQDPEDEDKKTVVEERIKERWWIPGVNLRLKKPRRPRLELHLSNNRFHELGTIELMKAFETNTSVAHLDISRNGLGAGKWDDRAVDWQFAGSVAIKKALKVNSTLQRLDVSHNSLGSDGASQIGEALLSNTTLTALNISHNHLYGEGAGLLAKAIKAQPVENEPLEGVSTVGGNLTGGLRLLEVANNDISRTKQKALKDICDSKGLSYFISTDPGCFNFEGPRRSANALRELKVKGKPSKRAAARRDRLPKIEMNWAAAGEDDEEHLRRMAVKEALSAIAETSEVEAGKM